VLFVVTVYLLCNDMTIATSNFCRKNVDQSTSEQNFKTVISVFLHGLMIFSLYEANDEKIQTSEFWTMISWVALLVWMRLIMSNLGDIERMSWLIGLIQNSCVAMTSFLLVLSCAITAFADSFNALDQKIMLKGERLDASTSTEEELLIARKELLDTRLIAKFNSWLDSWQEAFRASIGDFDVEGHLSYFSYVDWLIFFFAVLFMIILMLNLLISIIAEAQANYTGTKTQ